MTMESLCSEKKVTFNTSVNSLHIVARIDDASSNEKKNLWYNDDDYNRMKTRMIKSVLNIRRGYATKSEIYSRGLEFLLSEDQDQRKIVKDLVVQSVLKEQSRQKLVGVICPNDISAVSLFHSRWSTDLARSVGEKDTEVTRKFLDETDVSLEVDTHISNNKKFKSRRIKINTILTEALDLC